MLPSDMLECKSSPCGNGGTCIEQVNGYMCQCVRGYNGTECEDGEDCVTCLGGFNSTPLPVTSVYHHHT